MSNAKRRTHRSIRSSLRQVTLLLLVWTHRHTLALWFRSLRGALVDWRAGRTVHLRTLLAALVRVTADARIGNAPELRSLAVQDDVIVAAADEHWPRQRLLQDVVGGVRHVNAVTFVGRETGTTVTDVTQAS
jgi:hypothetical protein